MKSKILLLQPMIGEMDKLRTSPALPLALLQASALVVRDFEVSIFDRRLCTVDWSNELAKLLTDDLLLVGTTVFTGPMIASAMEMCRVVRELRPDLPIVWGGIHASMLPEQTLSDPLVDILVQGEGERAFAALAQALSQGRDPEGIPGVWWKKDGKIIEGIPAEVLELDSLPAPDWDILDVESYLPLYRNQKSFFFQSSRGCPNRCAFCYNVNYNRGCWRGLSAKKTIDRIIDVVDRYGAEDIYFVDDMFFTDIVRAREIALGLRDLEATWQLQGVDILGLKRMTDADLTLLWESGCSRLTVGIESGSPNMRRRIRKAGKIEDVLYVARRMADWPFTLYFSFMAGFPGETESDLRQTVDLIFTLLKMNSRIRISPLYIYTPYPGTELFEESIKLGFEPPTDLAGWTNLSYDRAFFKQKRRAFYEALYFTSLFLDDKTQEYTVPLLVRLLARAYKPIARFRTKHFFFHGLIERRAYEGSLALWKRQNR